MFCCFTSDCWIVLQLKTTLICRQVRLQHKYRQQPDDVSTSTIQWFKKILTFLHFIVISFLKALQKNFEIIFKAPLSSFVEKIRK